MTAPLPTPAEVAEMRERHVALAPDVHGVVWCATPTCSQHWPCDAARLLALVDAQEAEIADAWDACGGDDLAHTAEVSFGPAGGPLHVVEPSRRRTLGEFLRTVEVGMQAMRDDSLRDRACLAAVLAECDAADSQARASTARTFDGEPFPVLLDPDRIRRLATGEAS